MKPSMAPLAVLAASALWASSGLAVSLGHLSAAPTSVAATRLVFGGLAMAFIAKLGRTRQAWRRLNGRAIVQAVLGMALFQWTFFASVPHVGVGLASLLPSLLAPLAAEALAVAHPVHARPSRAWGSIGILLVGAALLYRSLEAVGLFLSVAAGVSYAFYADATKSVQRDHNDPADGLAITAVALLGAGVALLPMVGPNLHVALSWRDLVVGIYLALPATALAYAIFATALRHLSSAEALSLVTIPPSIGFILEVLLAPAPMPWSALCGLLVLGAPLAVRSAIPRLTRLFRPA